MSRTAPSASELLALATSLSTSGSASDVPDSNPASGAPAPLDPKWIDVLMGRDDAVRMRDCGKVLRDKEKSIEEKIVAFDELEMVASAGRRTRDTR